VVKSGVSLTIRPYRESDQPAVVKLWVDAGVTRPWNDPRADIERKRAVQQELFLVGELQHRLVASAMAGYDGHRGWIYYLAVQPDQQRRGYARAMMEQVETRLRELGCPKLNLQVRSDNLAAIGFYQRLGYLQDQVVSLGKRLIHDQTPIE
jgi:ribosomal protein S18 acetylase RimI-like enzyme